MVLPSGRWMMVARLRATRCLGCSRQQTVKRCLIGGRHWLLGCGRCERLFRFGSVKIYGGSMHHRRLVGRNTGLVAASRMVSPEEKEAHEEAIDLEYCTSPATEPFPHSSSTFGTSNNSNQSGITSQGPPFPSHFPAKNLRVIRLRRRVTWLQLPFKGHCARPGGNRAGRWIEEEFSLL